MWAGSLMTQETNNQIEVRQKSSLLGRIIGFLVLSLILSIIVEWLCMTFIWNEPGALHSKKMMLDEFNWFSSEFQKSLLYSKPVSLAEQIINFLYEWIFVKTGLQVWLNSPKIGIWRMEFFGQIYVLKYGQIIGQLSAYIEAMFYIFIVFIIRLLIIVLTSPLFILVAVVGVTDGLVQRDLRRFGVGRESAFKYHHAKSTIGPIMILGWILYLAIPISIHPNLILIPAAILFGFVISITASNFKKYL
ncbi:TIGR03747 family integrating conjugative element membrane protein [Pasteurella skyensis]|uniref:TIGR03747 family integrating conjugative element membrane protein n=1 Tax=Phocoenobacter skyensis TaxID=97481 RepID=UPI002745FA10|nr:TIGR03747 family integrating conjugative element membrane protein [Pasteurella skyensis]MDP8189075.1 TIGR03747 family integrating conjugative element membrane protein [Pasteurella skyensis]